MALAAAGWESARMTEMSVHRSTIVAIRARCGAVLGEGGDDMPYRSGFTLELLLEQTRDLPGMPTSVQAAIEAAYGEARARQAGRDLVGAIQAALRAAEREPVPEGTVQRLGAAVAYASGQAYVDALDVFVFPEGARQRDAQVQQLLGLSRRASAAGFRAAVDALRDLAEQRPEATVPDAVEHLARLADEQEASG